MDERLLFIGYMSFYNNKYFIKRVYGLMKLSDKYLYKYYVYSQRYLKTKECDLIWEWLNTDESDEKIDTLDNQLYKIQFRYCG